MQPVENQNAEFLRLREEHETKQLDLHLADIEDTRRYLMNFEPIEYFFKRLYVGGENSDFWDHADYYYEKYRFNFQFVQSNISVARHFRYDRHRPHSHDFFQMNFCLSGNGSVILGDEHPITLRMKPGDLNILSPETIHHVSVFTDDCIIIKYYIRKSTFERTFFAWLEEDDILTGFFRNAMSGDRDSYISFHTSGDSEIESLAMSIYMELMNHKPYFGILGESRLTELFCLLVRDHAGDASTRSESGRGESTAKLFAYLRENYRTATLEDAANAFGYSKNYLCRYVRKTTGKNFSGLLNEVRVAEAKKLLARGHGSISDVGRMVGYTSDAHFHRVFREMTGFAPREWVGRL